MIFLIKLILREAFLAKDIMSLSDGKNLEFVVMSLRIFFYTMSVMETFLKMLCTDWQLDAWFWGGELGRLPCYDSSETSLLITIFFLVGKY